VNLERFGYLAWSEGEGGEEVTVADGVVPPVSGIGLGDDAPGSPLQAVAARRIATKPAAITLTTV
jgi:hypothetical protein